MDPEVPQTPESPAESDLLKQIMKRLVALEDENAKLKLEVGNQSGYAPGVPLSMRRSDPNVDPKRMQCARSVTIATRPVVENPEQYQNVIGVGMIPSELPANREE